MTKHTILIKTNDKKGLVYQISKIIYEHNLNIEENSEFVCKNEKKFFMRTIVSGVLDKRLVLKDIQKVLPKDNVIKILDETKKDIVILVTKESHVLGDLLIRYEEGQLDVNIKAVISNYDTLQELVEKFDIDFHYVSSDGIDRKKHEIKIKKIIDIYNK